MRTFLRSAAIGTLAVGLLAAAPQSSASDARTALARSSSPPILIAACNRLAAALVASTEYGGEAPRDPERDADAAAVIAFLHSRHDVATRGPCARAFAMRTNAHMIDAAKREWHSAYGADAVDAVITLLHAPDAEMRIAASRALYGMPARPVGPVLLRVAQTDADSRVKAAAFRSLPLTMRADIATNHNAAIYRRTIISALRTNDPVVLPGALVALAGLDGVNADRTLRHYARSPKPAVRAGAIDAYDTMMEFNKGIIRFIESRLADPSPDVRDAVMLRLYRMGDEHAIPAILHLAASAPTHAERQSAADYAHALKSQP